MNRSEFPASLPRAALDLRRSGVIFAVCGLLGGPAWAVAPDDFYGTWIGPKEDISCDTIEKGEGTDFLIFEKNKYKNSVETCLKVNSWLEGNVMKYSAGCDGPEIGIQIRLYELRLGSNKL